MSSHSLFIAREIDFILTGSLQVKKFSFNGHRGPRNKTWNDFSVGGWLLLR